jgi:hypothetical protein
MSIAEKRQDSDAQLKSLQNAYEALNMTLITISTEMMRDMNIMNTLALVAPANCRIGSWLVQTPCSALYFEYFEELHRPRFISLSK